MAKARMKPGTLCINRFGQHAYSINGDFSMGLVPGGEFLIVLEDDREALVRVFSAQFGECRVWRCWINRTPTNPKSVQPRNHA